MARDDYTADFIWQTADLLRGSFDVGEYAEIMLPMLLLRQLDSMLAPTKQSTLQEHRRIRELDLSGSERDALLTKVTGLPFYNTSLRDFRVIAANPDRPDLQLLEYAEGFSENIRDLFEHYELDQAVRRMQDAGILNVVISRLSSFESSSDTLPGDQGESIFEELVSRLTELSQDVRGEYFTPRDVVKLMTALLLAPDSGLLAASVENRTLLDPACGTGGFLAEARRYARRTGARARLLPFGQEIDPQPYAVAASAEILKGAHQDKVGLNVRLGDSLVEDQFQGWQFDYFLSNPPWGVSWKKQRPDVEREASFQGEAGRFGAGLPRVNDSSLLFLQHMWSKRRAPEDGGSRLAVLYVGSPMFVGGAGSGESEIRKWLLENDWLEAIIALPESLFYGTRLGTYVWLLSNRKAPERVGAVQLVDARDIWTAGSGPDSSRSTGDKRRYISDAQVDQIVGLYRSCVDGPQSRVKVTSEFGYANVCIEYPLRLRYQMTVEGKRGFLNAYPSRLDDIQEIDKALGREPILGWTTGRSQIDALLADRGAPWSAHERRAFESVFTRADPDAEPVLDEKTMDGFVPDIGLREYEKVPLSVEPADFLCREITRYKPEAWLDDDKTTVGYEINFERYFQVFTPPRPVAAIEADLRRAEAEIARLLAKVIS